MFSRMMLLIELAFRSKANRWYLLVFLSFIPMLTIGFLSIFITNLLPPVLLNSVIPLFCIMTPLLIFFAIHLTVVNASNIMLNWFGADEDNAYEIVLNHVLGVNQPKIEAENGKIDLDENTKIIMDVGVLPVILTVNADTAVLTEFNGRPHMAYCEAGKYTLMPFEKISYAVKLRNQFTSLSKTKAITRDGISVSFKGGVGFHIRRIPGEPSIEDPYPVDSTAIYQVVYNRTIGEAGGNPAPPIKTVPFLVQAQVRNIVAQYRFSQLIELSLEGQESIPLSKLSAEVAEATRGIADRQGITVTFVGLEWELDEIEANVREQIRDNWRRTRDQQIDIALSDEEVALTAKRIDTILQTLKDKGYESDDLLEVRQMVEEVVYLKRDVYSLIGEEDDTFFGMPGVSPRGDLTQRRQRINGMTKEEEEALVKKFPGLATTQDDPEEGGKILP